MKGAKAGMMAECMMGRKVTHNSPAELSKEKADQPDISVSGTREQPIIRRYDVERGDRSLEPGRKQHDPRLWAPEPLPPRQRLRKQ